MWLTNDRHQVMRPFQNGKFVLAVAGRPARLPPPARSLQPPGFAHPPPFCRLPCQPKQLLLIACSASPLPCEADRPVPLGNANPPLIQHLVNATV